MPKEVSDRLERKAKAEKTTLSGAFLRIVENYIDDEEDELDDEEDLRLSNIITERIAARKAKGGRLIHTVPYKVLMSWKAEKDLAAMQSAAARQMLRAINERLATAPLDFGKPLRHNLNGMRSLRVGSWRIGYFVEAETVTINHIELRRDAYKDW
jgi:mRNA interferase RelE/StbE